MKDIVCKKCGERKKAREFVKNRWGRVKVCNACRRAKTLKRNAMGVEGLSNVLTGVDGPHSALTGKARGWKVVPEKKENRLIQKFSYHCPHCNKEVDVGDVVYAAHLATVDSFAANLADNVE